MVGPLECWILKEVGIKKQRTGRDDRMAVSRVRSLSTIDSQEDWIAVCQQRVHEGLVRICRLAFVPRVLTVRPKHIFECGDIISWDVGVITRNPGQNGYRYVSFVITGGLDAVRELVMLAQVRLQRARIKQNDLRLVDADTVDTVEPKHH